ADGLEAKIKQLNSILKAQKTQVALATEEWEKTKEAYGENSAEADRAKIKLNNLEAAVAKTEKELGTYEQDLKDCKEGTGRFSDELDESGSSMKDADKNLKDLDDGFTTMKAVMADLVATGIKAMISGFKDLASAAKEAYEEFDAAEDTMIAKTGATGKELEGLRDTYVNVSKDIVADSNDIANAIGEISTKFGLSGDELQSFSEKMLKFSQLNNTDVSTSIDNVYSAMTAWGISMEDADKFLDLLNATGQTTEASVDKLTSSLTTNAASLKDMGFSVDEATTFLGQLELAGVDADTVMQGLKKALANSAKEGTSTKDALAELQATMAASTSDSEKTVAAMELFGTKAGPAIAEACASGRLNFEDLGNAMTDYEGNLDKTYDATLDASDKIKLTFQGMKAEVGQYISEMLDENSEDIDELLGIIKDAFKDVMNAIKQNAPAIKDTIKGVITTIAKLLTGLINNFDGIMTIVKAVGTVLIATFAVNKITSFISMIVGLVKTFQTLKTATEGATTAQQLLNAAQSANVIGAVTAAVAGLAAAVLWLISTDDEYKEQLPTLTEEEQKHVDSINEMTEAYRNMEAERKENIAGIQEEYAHYGELKEELETLVDENGKVKEGYEDRANFIIGTLNDALGTEITLTDGIIDNYREEIDAIDELLQKKEAQAVLTASEEAYTEAVKNSKTALTEMTEAGKIYKANVDEMNDAESRLTELQSLGAEKWAELNDICGDADDIQKAYNSTLKKTEDELHSAQGAVGETRTAYEKAKSTYEGYQSTIKNYEGLSSAIISGDASKINEAMDNMVYNFQTAETATKETLEKQVKDYEENLKLIEQAIKDGTPGVSEETRKQAETMVKKAKDELAKAPDEAKKYGKETGSGYASEVGSESNKQAAKNSGASLANAAAEGAKPGDAPAKEGNQFADEYAGGIDSNSGKSAASAKSMGENANSALESGSGDTKSSGENFGQGFVNGIQNKTNDVWSAAFNMAKKALEALKKGQKEGSPSKLTRLSGQYFGEGYELGITDMTKNVVAAATRLAFDAVSGLDQDSKKSGVDLVAGFIDGIESMSGEAENAVSGLGQGAFVKGFKNMASKARNSINNLMENSGNGLIAGLKDSTFTARENLSIPTSSETGYYSNVSNVTNNYNLNQTNNSPKSLSALETYQARRQQIALLKSIL
ncbi:MAG: phage tail tape measure protein, partial [Eubacterium sp.]|nr:phage tail tape measure protein [Eubacterium sp.]